MVPQSGQSLQAARLWQGRPDAFGMATALRRATEDGARFLGRDDIGRLEPGGRADIAVWSGEDLATCRTRWPGGARHAHRALPAGRR